MDRLPGIALMAGGVTAVVGLAVNGGPLLPVVLVVGGAAVLGLQRLTLRPVRDVEWGVAGADGAAWAPLPVLPLGAAEVRRPEPSSGCRVAAALARVESGQLDRSPWFAAGIGFCLIIVGLLGWAAAGDSNLPWRDIIANFPVMAHPLVGMVVVATHSAVTRARRDGAGELFESCPLPLSTRTAGHLLTAWVPVATLGLFMATYVVVVAVRAPFNYGPIDGAAAGDVTAALALGVGGVALGAALGRWAPWRLVPIAAVFALLQPIVAIGNIGAPHWSNARQLSAWPRYPNHDLLFTIRPVWWHLVWLLALAAIVACVALARTGWHPVAIPLAAAALVATVAGVAETRPLDEGKAARLASMVSEPERHQACESTGRARVCAFGGYGRFASVMAAEAAPVMAAVPEPAPAVVVRQIFDGDLRALGPEVVEALHGRGVGGGPAAVRLFDISRETRSAVRLTTALAAIGLPARPPATKVPVLVAGQARGVLAIWLAARGLPAGEAVRLATAFHPTDSHDPANLRQGSRQARGSAWPDACSAGPPPVAWAPEDLAAARAVLALPEADVARVVRARWAELTDPSATTDVFLQAVGLDPIGPPPAVIVGPVECTY